MIYLSRLIIEISTARSVYDRRNDVVPGPGVFFWGGPVTRKILTAFVRFHLAN
jgi:hypothetical protein